jgi:hypothetical protein
MPEPLDALSTTREEDNHKAHTGGQRSIGKNTVLIKLFLLKILLKYSVKKYINLSLTLSLCTHTQLTQDTDKARS